MTDTNPTTNTSPRAARDGSGDFADVVSRARSDRDRAISRGGDLIARYLGDARGWGSPTTWPELVAQVRPHAAQSDVQDAVGDLIADVLHALAYLGGDDESAHNIAMRHVRDECHDYEPADFLPVEYVPECTGYNDCPCCGQDPYAGNDEPEPTYEPMIVVVRHPDWGTDTSEHYLDATVVDIDLGNSFDITAMGPDDADTALEYATDLRKKVEHLPDDHTGRWAVLEQVEHIESVVKS